MINYYGAFIATSAVILLTIGCKKEKPFGFLEEQGLYDAGKTKATLNDKPWESTFTFVSYFPEGSKRLAIDAKMYRGETLVQEFEVLYINLQQKTNNLSSFFRISQLSYNDTHRYDTACASFALSEDVGVLATYDVLENPETHNQILIEAVDTVRGTISGHFQITFFKRDGLVPTPYGFADTLKFTDGSFVFKLP